MVNHAAKMLAAAKRARQAFAENTKDQYAELFPGRRIEMYYIQTSAGRTRLLIYRPEADGKCLRPVFVNIHGGGFVQGRAEDDGVYCQRIADAVDCCVVSIDYHLSPEHKFPVALEECYDAVKWIHDRAAELGFDASRIAVGGHSAGGNLTAVILSAGARPAGVSHPVSSVGLSNAGYVAGSVPASYAGHLAHA